MKKILYSILTLILAPIIVTLTMDLFKGEAYLTTFKEYFVLVLKKLAYFFKIDIQIGGVILLICVFGIIYYFRGYIFGNENERLISRIKKDHKNGIVVQIKTGDLIVYFVPYYYQGNLKVTIKHINYIKGGVKIPMLNYYDTFECDEDKLKVKKYELSKTIASNLYSEYRT